jgi:hypothetical protein
MSTIRHWITPSFRKFCVHRPTKLLSRGGGSGAHLYAVGVIRRFRVVASRRCGANRVASRLFGANWVRRIRVVAGRRHGASGVRWIRDVADRAQLLASATRKLASISRYSASFAKRRIDCLTRLVISRCQPFNSFAWRFRLHRTTGDT